MTAIITRAGCHMAREPMPDRRHIWRQKVRITDANTGADHVFYVDFGEYEDGRLGEVFITSKKMGTFARGVMDTLARSLSLCLQSGTPPHAIAAQLIAQDYPPQGAVTAEGSSVTHCSSIADYIGQEIVASYGEGGRRHSREVPEPIVSGCGDETPYDVTPEKVAGYTSETWRTGA